MRGVPTGYYFLTMTYLVVAMCSKRSVIQESEVVQYIRFPFSFKYSEFPKERRILIFSQELNIVVRTVFYCFSMPFLLNCAILSSHQNCRYSRRTRNRRSISPTLSQQNRTYNLQIINLYTQPWESQRKERKRRLVTIGKLSTTLIEN